jgi:GNAT superfamily N-acetyltransferase
VADVVPFGRKHLDGVVALFEGEQWPNYTRDAERTFRALSAPGSTTLVAVEKGRVIAVAQLQSDGEVQAHLSTIVVAGDRRGRGIGRRLIRDALRRAGGLRIDTISASDDFYIALGAQRFSGFRLRAEDLESEGP